MLHSKSGKVRLAVCAAAITTVTASMASPAFSQITVNYTIGSSLASDPQSAQIIGAFQRAANNWTSQFDNTFKFNFTIDFSQLSVGVLGSTNSSKGTISYDGYRSALAGTAHSADDFQAISSLPTSSSLPLLLNGVRDNPNGRGSLTPYLDNNGDANNATIRMTLANAKAMGLLDPNNSATDAAITFSSRYRSYFDFNPDDGISAGQFDFVGIATHEIGHALGFISGVDTLDINRPTTGSMNFYSYQFTYVSPLDTFRYSTISSGINGGVVDFTIGSAGQYFSLDRGQTRIADFSTGSVYGDGRQASHWKDNLGIGLMDPTADFAESLRISNTDLRAFDVIGYTLVPEPGVVAFGIIAGTSLLGLIIRKRKP